MNKDKLAELTQRSPLLKKLDKEMLLLEKKYKLETLIFLTKEGFNASCDEPTAVTYLVNAIISIYSIGILKGKVDIDSLPQALNSIRDEILSLVNKITRDKEEATGN